MKVSLDKACPTIGSFLYGYTGLFPMFLYAIRFGNILLLCLPLKILWDSILQVLQMQLWYGTSLVGPSNKLGHFRVSKTSSDLLATACPTSKCATSHKQQKLLC